MQRFAILTSTALTAFALAAPARAAEPAGCVLRNGISECKNLAYGPLSAENKTVSEDCTDAVTGQPLGNTQRLDLYKPPGAGPFPLIVFVHGGGWTGGCRALSATDWLGLKRQVGRGYAVASIDYRWASDTVHFPLPLHDVKQAVRWLKWRAGSYGLDARRVALWGHSAGAHLAALAGATTGRGLYEPTSFGSAFAALKCQSSSASLVIGYGGVYDFRQELDWNPNVPPEWQFTRGVTDGASRFLGCDIPNGSVLSQLPACTDAWRAQGSPMNYLAGPPVFMAHGTNDPFAHPFQPHAYKLTRDNAAQPTGLRWIEGGSHGFHAGLWRDGIASDVDFVLDVFVRASSGTSPVIPNCTL